MSDFTGLISDDFKQIHVDAMTELVRGLALPCRLIYGQTLVTECTNCIYDPISGRSSNRYKTGGSTPFSGVCPVCLGQGKTVDEQTVDIDLAVIYDYRGWIPIGVKVDSPNGFVQTFCLLESYEAIKKAKELIVNTDVEERVRQRFERYGEPVLCGLGQATLVVTMWKRIEN